MRYNDKGEELMDDTPVEAPLKFRRPPSIQEMIALYVRNTLSLERQMGSSSRSQADEEEDFDVDEDGDEDIMTPYELHAMSAEVDSELRRSKPIPPKGRPEGPSEAMPSSDVKKEKAAEKPKE